MNLNMPTNRHIWETHAVTKACEAKENDDMPLLRAKRTYHHHEKNNLRRTGTRRRDMERVGKRNYKSKWKNE